MNSSPALYEGAALPTELRWQIAKTLRFYRGSSPLAIVIPPTSLEADNLEANINEGETMTELELIQIWNKLRNQVIFSQLAPTFLLIVTIALINDGLADSAIEVRIATMGILLASGIFGYLAQYSTATEARAVLAEIRALKTKSKLSIQLIRFANWLDVIRYVTPTIFVGIYVFLVIALLF